MKHSTAQNYRNNLVELHFVRSSSLSSIDVVVAFFPYPNSSSSPPPPSSVAVIIVVLYVIAGSNFSSSKYARELRKTDLWLSVSIQKYHGNKRCLFVAALLIYRNCRLTEFWFC